MRHLYVVSPSSRTVKEANSWLPLCQQFSLSVGLIRRLEGCLILFPKGFFFDHFLILKAATTTLSKFIQTIWRFWGLHGSFQGKLPYDILCLQFFLLACRLHHAFFTKCLKPLEKYWRFNGVNIALFLDDGWLIDSDRDTCAVLLIFRLMLSQGLWWEVSIGIRVKFVNGWGLPMMERR